MGTPLDPFKFEPPDCGECRELRAATAGAASNLRGGRPARHDEESAAPGDLGAFIKSIRAAWQRAKEHERASSHAVWPRGLSGPETSVLARLSFACDTCARLRGGQPYTSAPPEPSAPEVQEHEASSGHLVWLPRQLDARLHGKPIGLVGCLVLAIVMAGFLWLVLASRTR